jgi:hypothetical protein
MIRIKLAVLCGLISLFFSCKSVKKNIDVVKTSSNEVERTHVTNDLQTSDISIRTFEERDTDITIESNDGEKEVSIERIGNKIIFRGAKKINISHGNTKTIEKAENNIRDLSVTKQENKKVGKNETIKKDIQKKGTPFGVVIFIGVCFVGVVLFFLNKKKPNFIQSILSILKKTK